jgi:hypothetical protein
LVIGADRRGALLARQRRLATDGADGLGVRVATSGWIALKPHRRARLALDRLPRSIRISKSIEQVTATSVLHRRPTFVSSLVAFTD